MDDENVDVLRDMLSDLNRIADDLGGWDVLCDDIDDTQALIDKLGEAREAADEAVGLVRELLENAEQAKLDEVD